MSRAVRFDRHGGPEVLYVADVDPPSPRAGEVQVQVKAGGINSGETSIRAGAYAERWPATFPSGEGSDFAGVVSAVGDGVTAPAVGAEVIGWTDQRASHAQYVAVPADQVVPEPPQVPWEVTGGLYVAGGTAVGVVAAVAPHEGDTVVVSGTAGGVAALTVQLTRREGADVIGIASAASTDWLTAHGVRPVA
jgi:NADPH2:quinone reductase